MSRRKKKTFKRALAIYTLLLVIVAEICLLYVNSTLKKYELGDVNNYLNNFIEDLQKAAKRENITKYFEAQELESKYEDEVSLAKGYKELLASAEMSYEKVKDTQNEYYIYADDLRLAKIVLDGSKTEKRLGLLNYIVWEIKEIDSYNENGIYELDIYLPSTLNLFINNTEASEEDVIATEKISEYEEVYDLVDLPSIKHYHIANLTMKPEIQVKDQNGEKVATEYKDGAYYATNYFQTDDESLAMSKLDHEFDALQFAKNWSLFLTNDLGGVRHGLYKLTPNLIEGTEMYQRAYSWATGIDITFTSIHTLAREPFTNVKVTNFTVYNKNAFSVQIYLEKNINIAGGQKQVDILHDIFYYVYYDGAYRLVKMQSVSN